MKMIIPVWLLSLLTFIWKWIVWKSKYTQQRSKGQDSNLWRPVFEYRTKIFVHESHHHTNKYICLKTCAVSSLTAHVFKHQTTWKMFDAESAHVSCGGMWETDWTAANRWTNPEAPAQSWVYFLHVKTPVTEMQGAATGKQHATTTAEVRIKDTLVWVVLRNWRKCLVCANSVRGWKYWNNADIKPPDVIWKEPSKIKGC